MTTTTGDHLNVSRDETDRSPNPSAVGLRMLMATVAKARSYMSIHWNGAELTWLGYACARIEGPNGTVVYTDPGRYGSLDGTWSSQYGGRTHPAGSPYEAMDGDLVLVTHDHHYDSDGIRRVAGEEATVLVHESIDADLIGSNGRSVEAPEELPFAIDRVSAGDRYSIDGVDIQILPAYNDPDGPNVHPDGTPIHPEGQGCGFRFSVAETSYCWPGDTDVLDAHLKMDVSVLLPSISSSYTMNRHDAAELAAAIRPDLVVPIHYNTFDALQADSRAFAADVAYRQIPVALDERTFAPEAGS